MRHFVACLVYLSSLAAFAQLEELENPGSVSAIQERAYRMHHELNLSVGILPLDAFYKGFYGQVSYTYHFTDSFAWQVGRGAYSYTLDTGLRKQLQDGFNVSPTDFETIQYFVGSDLVWTPLYGKFAVLNRSVIHMEMFGILGATAFKYTNAFRPGVNFGIGFRVFQNKYVSYRLDVTDNVVIGRGTSGPSISNALTASISLAVNFGYD